MINKMCVNMCQIKMHVYIYISTPPQCESLYFIIETFLSTETKTCFCFE